MFAWRQIWAFICGGDMASSRRLSSVVCAMCLCSVAGSALSAERGRRELRFPKGGSFVAAVALASLLPKGPTDGFAHVLEFDLGFPFPEVLAIGKAQSEQKMLSDPYERISIQSKSRTKKKHSRSFSGKRNLKDRQRQNLVWQVEDVLTRMGFNGSSCLTRLHCELQNLTRNSLLEELFLALFDTFNLSHRQCHRTHSLCPISLLHLAMHSQSIPQTSPPFNDAFHSPQMPAPHTGRLRPSSSPPLAEEGGSQPSRRQDAPLQAADKPDCLRQDFSFGR